MTVRVFDGTDDEIRFPVPAEMTGALTMAAVVKHGVDGATDNVVTDHTSGGTPKAGMEINSANKLQWDNGDGGTALSTTTVLTATGWYLLAITKAAGTTTPRMHIYRFSDSNQVHEAGSGTVANALTTAGGTTRLGEWGDLDDLNGKIAVVGYWTSELSDAQVDALATGRATANWVSHAVTPVWVVEPGMNTPVEDLIGANDSTTITGTTTDADDPASWVYGAAPTPSFELIGRGRSNNPSVRGPGHVSDALAAKRFE